MPGHRIQLRGPWEAEPVVPAKGVRSRVQLPVSWSAAFGEFTGAVRLKRRFHRPTNLGPTDEVRLVFIGLTLRGTISVNGQPLGTLEVAPGELTFDITALLQPTNHILIEIAGPPEDRQRLLWQLLAIEIE